MIKRSVKWLALAAGSSVLGLVLMGNVGVGVARAEDKGDVEVKFDLPKAVFAGTPKNIPPGTTVQKPTGKPRPPQTRIAKGGKT